MSGYYNRRCKGGALWCTLLAVCAVVFMSGCSNQSAPEDARKLLSTVPSDAGVVCVADVESLIDDSGLTKKDAQSLLKDDKKHDVMMRAVTDPASGVRATAAVYFASGGDLLTTFLLDDSEKFRIWLEQTMSDVEPKRGDSFWSKSGEAYLHAGRSNSFTVLDNQVWMSNGVAPVDETTVAAFSELSESRSVIGQEYGAKLAECDDMVAFYAPLAGLMDVAGLSFADRTQIRMFSSMLFEDVSAIAGTADIDGRTLKFECSVLNDKGKKARCNLKLGKIDVQKVAALGGDAETIFAVSLPHALMQQLIKSSKTLGGSYPAAYEAVMECLDGTAAVAAGLPDSTAKVSRSPLDTPFTAFISTRGNQAPLMELFYNAGIKPSAEAGQVLVKNGNYGKGALNVAATAEEMKGAVLAIASHGSIPMHLNSGASVCSGKMLMMLVAEDKSLELRVNLTPDGDSKYFIVNMLGAAAGPSKQ